MLIIVTLTSQFFQVFLRVERRWRRNREKTRFQNGGNECFGFYLKEWHMKTKFLSRSRLGDDEPKSVNDEPPDKGPKERHVDRHATLFRRGNGSHGRSSGNGRLRLWCFSKNGFDCPKEERNFAMCSATMTEKGEAVTSCRHQIFWAMVTLSRPLEKPNTFGLPQRVPLSRCRDCHCIIGHEGKTLRQLMGYWKRQGFTVAVTLYWNLGKGEKLKQPRRAECATTRLFLFSAAGMKGLMDFSEFFIS